MDVKKENGEFITLPWLPGNSMKIEFLSYILCLKSIALLYVINVFLNWRTEVAQMMISITRLNLMILITRTQGSI